MKGTYLRLLQMAKRAVKLDTNMKLFYKKKRLSTHTIYTVQQPHISQERDTANKGFYDE